MRHIKILCNYFIRNCSQSTGTLSKCVESKKQETLKKKETPPKGPRTELDCQVAKKAEIERALMERFERKSVRVAVVGADTLLGQNVGFVLKQNPIVSRIFLYGHKRVNDVVADLNQIDTRSLVSGHPDDLPAAIRSADIILLLGTDYEDAESTAADKLRREGESLIERATVCSYFAPRSILMCCVDPVAVTLPLVRAVYQAGKWYHPGKVIGSVALSQMRANTLVARYQDLDPLSVDVPLIGGPDVNTAIPLFTRATPAALTVDESVAMLKKFRALPYDADLKTESVPTKLGPAPYGEAFAINRAITNIALGVCGDATACVNAFVRTNAVTTSAHLTSTVRFGVTGLTHNYGLPRLYKTETELLFAALHELERCEQIAAEYFLAYVEKKDEQLKAEAAKKSGG